jgi:Flp pilus assembly protein TadD
MEKACQLAEQGRASLDREEYNKAEEKLALALAEFEDPVVRNNLAMAQFLQGKAEEALATLAGHVNERPNPFGKALMAQCLAALGRMTEARKAVSWAVKEFESIVAMSRKANLGEAWRVYTVMVMRAAGAVFDHYLVVDLYKRWQKYHVSWENKYLAGVAAFNLKRFRQAASYWSSLRELPYAHQMQLVCFLADQGVVPPFVMDYKLWKIKPDGKIEDMLQSGALRMLLLMTVFDERSARDNASDALGALVKHGGEWGERLGKSLLEASAISMEIKMMALQALFRAGVYKEGEKVTLLVDGKERYVTVSQVVVDWEPDEEVQEKCRMALNLRDKGKQKEAIDILEELNTGPRIYPLVMLALANLYRDCRMPDKARNILEMMEKIEPDNAVFLFNLAVFCLENGDREKAKAYLERIDASQAPQAFKKKLARLRDFLLQGTGIFQRSLLQFWESSRIEVEEKKLPAAPTMSRGLRNMPVKWVRKACDFWQVDCRLRKDGEAGLAEAVCSPDRVHRAALRLKKDERELLRYVLVKGGYASVSAISRKFGSMAGDGYLVGKEPPRSALGRLWLKGFVFVGKTLLNGRNVKIAAIPVEMREELHKVLVNMQS